MGVCLFVCICGRLAPWLEHCADEAQTGAPMWSCQLLSFKGHGFILDLSLLLHTCLVLANKEIRLEIMHCFKPIYHHTGENNSQHIIPVGISIVSLQGLNFWVWASVLVQNVKTLMLEMVTNHVIDRDSSGARPL